jgi:transcriptional regulator with XRE-family HTH domain
MQEQLQAIRERIGSNVRQLRTSRGWSQQQLAELVGNTDKHIGQVERGEVNVSIDILTAIAAHLSVEVVQLFDDPSAEYDTYTIPRTVLDSVEATLRAVLDAKRPARPRLAPPEE